MKRLDILAIVILFIAPVVVVSTPEMSISAPLAITLGSATGKTVVSKTGTLASSATTADQVLVTYTVTAGKTFYVSQFDFTARLTTYAATATNFGECSLESPAGTKLYTMMNANAGAPVPITAVLSEPLPIASGVVVRLVCTPSAATAFTWRGNMVGFER